MEHSQTVTCSGHFAKSCVRTIPEIPWRIQQVLVDCDQLFLEFGIDSGQTANTQQQTAKRRFFRKRGGAPTQVFLTEPRPKPLLRHGERHGERRAASARDA